MINWEVRIKNKVFWLTIIPAVAILVQSVLAVFNIQFDYSELVKKLLAVVEAVFGVLVIIGVVTDPTTAGVGDSKRAMSYNEPWQDDPLKE